MYQKINEELVKEARDYALASCPYTYDGHNFSLQKSSDTRFNHILLGKLGEKAFKMWLEKEKINYIEDDKPITDPDSFDFKANGLTIDIKSTLPHCKWLLEKKKLYESKPKDVYVLVKVKLDSLEASIIGFEFGKELAKNPVNLGYGEDYGLTEDKLTGIDFLLGVLCPKTLSDFV